MAKKSEIVEQLNAVTDKISTQVRSVALGVLALSWGLFIGESEVAKSVASQLKWHLLLVGAAAVLVMFLDFLQYVSGYLNVRALLAQMEQKKVDEGQYDYGSRTYRLRLFFFGAKQVVLAVTVLWLLVVLGRWLLATS